MVVVLLAPHVLRTRGGTGHALNQSANNMRQIGLGLFEFETEFGSYPNDTTLAVVRERYSDSKIPLGTSSSNDFFHQLFAAGIMKDPSDFHGYGVSTRRPFEIRDGEPPLPPGICGFAYIITDGGSALPDTPLVVYPLVKGKFVFDRRLCKLGGGKAYVLRADNSVRRHSIDSSGRMIIEGRDLFDPAQAHWQGRGFQVKWPE